MYKRKSGSINYKILKSLISKIRHLDRTSEEYLILAYAFLYKYCSESLKDYFLSVIEDKEITLSEAYQNNEYKSLFREDALSMFGYYIDDPDLFMGELINNDFTNKSFFHDFIISFPHSVKFIPGSNYEKYFNFFFKTVREEVNFNLVRENPSTIVLKDIVVAISKLDFDDEVYSFNDVFESVSQMFVHNDNSEYLNDIFSAIVSSHKEFAEKIYNPFLVDGSSFINLSENFNFRCAFGKEKSKLNYCGIIVKLVINYFNLDYVFLENSNAMDSMDFNGNSFDVIIAKIPNSKYSHQANRRQNIEIAKQSKRNELEDMLRSNFNMDVNSFSGDSDFKDALESLVEKMDFDNDFGIKFSGEYESLKDSEFLFLLNLINSLNSDGVMAVSISQNFLFKTSLATLRKYLTYENNFIDAIISIPNELSRHFRPEVIIVFKRNRIDKDILFIDMSKDYLTDRAANIVPGLFRRNLILHKDTLKKLVNVYENRSVIDKFSNLIDINEIGQNDFNLSISRYVDTFDGEFVRLADLKTEREEISKNLDVLNKKIDRMMNYLNIKF